MLSCRIGMTDSVILPEKRYLNAVHEWQPNIYESVLIVIGNCFPNLISRGRSNVSRSHTGGLKAVTWTSSHQRTVITGTKEESSFIRNITDHHSVLQWFLALLHWHRKWLWFGILGIHAKGFLDLSGHRSNQLVTFWWATVVPDKSRISVADSVQCDTARWWRRRYINAFSK